MQIKVPANDFFHLPPWEFRTIHNKTNIDLIIDITHDDLKCEHLYISDTKEVKEKEEEIKE